MVLGCRPDVRAKGATPVDDCSDVRYAYSTSDA